MILGFGNNISGAISTSITASQTVIPVSPGTGSKFASALTYASIIPSSISGSVPIFAKVTLTDTQETVFEICHLVSVSGDNLTVIRGQEGTTAKSWSLNDTIANFATKGSEDRFVQIEELQRGFYLSATATGTGNALVVSLPSTLGENATAAATANFSAPVQITPSAANTGNVTISASAGLLAFTTNAPLLKGKGLQMAPGDLQAGMPFTASWSETDKCWYHSSSLGANSYATPAAVQAGAYLYAADTGTANAYIAAFTPAVTTLVDGMVLRVKAKNGNTAGSTFTPASGVVTTYPIVDLNYAALLGGEIAAGGEMCLQFDSAISSWVLLSSAAGLPTSSRTRVGPTDRIRNITSAGATSTGWIDDSVIVGISGTSKTWIIPNFGATLSLSTVGIGGLDTGSAVAGGFILVYAAYNPSTKQYGVFGQLESSSTNSSMGAPATYAGSNLPSGYTATALISIAPVGTSATTFASFTQIGRKIKVVKSAIVSGTTTGTSKSWQTVTSSLIPYGALSFDGLLSMTSNYTSGAITMQGSVSPVAEGPGQTDLLASGSGGICSNDSTFVDMPLHNPRSFAYYFFNSVSTTASVLSAVIINGYKF